MSGASIQHKAREYRALQTLRDFSAPDRISRQRLECAVFPRFGICRIERSLPPKPPTSTLQRAKLHALGIGWSSAALCFAFLLLAGSAAFAGTPVLATSEFDAANRLYEQGKYTEAAAAYEKLAHTGPASASVYYNLGNAFFKGGQLGRAIAAYEQARQLTPRDPDLQANLQFARNQVQGPTILPEWWRRWLGRLTLNEWSLCAAGSLWVFFLLLAAQQWRPAWKAALRNWGLTMGLLTVLLGVLAFFALQQQRSSQAAVIVARDTPVRQGPLNESPTAFTAQDGSELRVLDRKDDWFQVRADARRIGWVRRDQVVLAPGV